MEECRENLTRGGHAFGVYDGDRLVALAETTAENSVSAMVVGVATLPGWRGRGFARACVHAAAAHSFAAGRRYLCLCCFSKRMRKLFRKNEKNVLRFCNKKAKEKGVYNGLKSPCKRLLNTCENGSFRRRWREHSSLSSAPFVMHSAARRWRVPQPCLHRPRRRSRPPKQFPRCRGSAGAR